MLNTHGLQVGNGGWVRYLTSGTPLIVTARLIDQDGVFRVAELHVEPYGAFIVGQDLRGLSVATIEALANDAENAELIESRWAVAGPKLRPLARAFATTPDDAEGWVADAIREDEPPLLDLPEQPAPIGDAEPEPVVLAVPRTKPYPDEFYEDVARAFQRLAVKGRPAVLIAEQLGVPVATVHGWVGQARKRGHLPPARQGRTSQ